MPAEWKAGRKSQLPKRESEGGRQGEQETEVVYTKQNLSGEHQSGKERMGGAGWPSPSFAMHAFEEELYKRQADFWKHLDRHRLPLRAVGWMIAVIMTKGAK